MSHSFYICSYALLFICVYSFVVLPRELFIGALVASVVSVSSMAYLDLNRED